MKFVIATGNEGKVREFKRILEPMGFEVLSLKEMGLTLDVEETGATFAENARIKAQEACRLTGLAAVADDSGLCVDALNGAPGIYSARYSGEGDDGNNQKLLRQLAGVPAEKRTGRYICAISCIFPDQTELTAEGICEGKIGYALSGDHGFGYDPLFLCPEYGRSYAQITPEEKNRISHRAKALQGIKKIIDELGRGQARGSDGKGGGI